MKIAWWIALGFVLACTPAPLPQVVASDRLHGTDGKAHVLAPLASDGYTVVIFFSADCHVLRAHDDRVRALADRFASRRVRFLAVDSEVDATLERDRAEAERRRYPFPILLDQGARVARSLGAEYAGHTVILDAAGNVLYRGGIDSDRVHLRDDATPYLADALGDLLAGKSARVAESKPLGCTLRLR